MVSSTDVSLPSWSSWFSPAAGGVNSTAQHTDSCQRRRAEGLKSREEGFSFRPGEGGETPRVMSELEERRAPWSWNQGRVVLSAGEGPGLRGRWREGCQWQGARAHVLSYSKESSGGHWETSERLSARAGWNLIRVLEKWLWLRWGSGWRVPEGCAVPGSALRQGGASCAPALQAGWPSSCCHSAGPGGDCCSSLTPRRSWVVAGPSRG